MTPMSEFAPIDEPVSSSARLEIDFMHQQDLIFDMKRTVKDLSEHPLVIPSYRAVALARVAILGTDGQKSPTDHLSFRFSETKDGRRNAFIDILENTSLTRLELSQTQDVWEVWHHGDKEPSQYLESDRVVRELEPKFHNKDILQPLLDSAHFSAIEIPRMLARHLAKKAEQKVIYQTDDSIMQGLDFDVEDRLSAIYSSTINTRLMEHRHDGITTHTLSTQAPYAIGATKINKEYIYSADTQTNELTKAEGRVIASSRDGYARKKLDTYVKQDQVRNDPIYNLQRGIDALRDHYDLD
jgi:hypothetical protein